MNYKDYLYKVPMIKIEFEKGNSREKNGILICKDNNTFFLNISNEVCILKEEIYKECNVNIASYINLTYKEAKLLFYDSNDEAQLKDAIIDFINNYKGKIEGLVLCVVDANDIKRENYARLLDPDYSSLMAYKSGEMLANQREQVSNLIGEVLADQCKKGSEKMNLINEKLANQREQASNVMYLIRRR